MAEPTTVARPYAEAAFKLARDAERAAGVVGDAALLAASVARRRGVRAALDNPEARRARERRRCSCRSCGDQLDGAGGRNFVQRAGREPTASTLLPQIRDACSRR